MCSRRSPSTPFSCEPRCSALACRLPTSRSASGGCAARRLPGCRCASACRPKRSKRPLAQSSTSPLSSCLSTSKRSICRRLRRCSRPRSRRRRLRPRSRPLVDWRTRATPHLADRLRFASPSYRARAPVRSVRRAPSTRVCGIGAGHRRPHRSRLPGHRRRGRHQQHRRCRRWSCHHPCRRMRRAARRVRERVGRRARRARRETVGMVGARARRCLRSRRLPLSHRGRLPCRRLHRLYLRHRRLRRRRRLPCNCLCLRRLHLHCRRRHLLSRRRRLSHLCRRLPLPLHG